MSGLQLDVIDVGWPAAADCFRIKSRYCNTYWPRSEYSMLITRTKTVNVDIWNYGITFTGALVSAATGNYTWYDSCCHKFSNSFKAWRLDSP